MKPVSPLLIHAPVLWLASFVRAEDRLPDAAAALAYLHAGSAEVEGWWQEEFPAEWKWPDSLLEIRLKSAPANTVQMHSLRGSVRDGEGRVTEVTLARSFGPDGKAATAELAFDIFGTPATLTCQLTPDGHWSAEFFNGKKRTQQRAAGPEEVFRWVTDQDTGLRAAMTQMDAGIKMARPSGAVWKVEAATLTQNGTGMDVWRATAPGERVIDLARKDGAVVAWAGPGARYHRAATGARETLKTAMKAIRGPRVRVESVREASIIFHTLDVPPLPESPWQHSERDGGNTIVLRGPVADKNPEPSTSLTSWLENGAALSSYADFRALAEKMKSHPDDSDPVAAVRFARSLLKEKAAPEASPARRDLVEALEKGADPVSLTRLTVALLRSAHMAAREVHGFVLHPDSLPVQAERRSWVEVLHEGNWQPVDPDLTLAFMPDDGEEESPTPGLTGLHVKICDGPPGAKQERFLQSPPVVSVQTTVLRPPDWHPDPRLLKPVERRLKEKRGKLQ